MTFSARLAVDRSGLRFVSLGCARGSLVVCWYCERSHESVAISSASATAGVGGCLLVLRERFRVTPPGPLFQGAFHQRTSL